MNLSLPRLALSLALVGAPALSTPALSTPALSTPALSAPGLSAPGLSAPALAQNPASGSEAAFHRAYFLEREQGQLEEALDLYRSVATSGSASAVLKEAAQERAASLSEDLASVDLARLMPPAPILYAELNQPGEAIEGLLAELGLMGSFEEAARNGTLRVRPEMIQSLLGIRGMALAVTRVPENGGPPGGVLVLNVGDVEVLRGLIEAAVLAQGTPAEAIEGVPTWTFEGQVFVSVGRRIVVAATEREESAAVLRRLAGSEEGSLASNPDLREQLAGRANAPLFCMLNAAPLRPMMQGLLAQATAGQTALALAAAALDPMHMKSLVARLQLGDDTLSLDADLYLEDEHRNLVFNLLRRATLDPSTLDRIPEGAAFFAAGAFNERGPALAPLERNAEGAPVVSLLDFGRELFANLAGYTFYVLPGGAPIPNAALVLSSNDPARTGAVLGLLLGLGNVMTSGQTLEGSAYEIAGAPTRLFRMPLGIPLYLTTHENELILSASEELIEQAVEGRSNGGSVLFDEAFADELGRLHTSTTFAVCAHLGRTLEVLRPFIGGGERKQLERFAPLVSDTVVALQGRHSETQMGLGIAAHGLPQVDGLVGMALQKARSTSGYGEPVGLQAGFARLAQREDGAGAARAFAREQLKVLQDDPRALNNFAWALLTEERFASHYDDLAGEFAQRSVEASKGNVWQYLDTLALARFRAGSVQEAVRFEEQALGLVEASADRAELEKSLERFRAAAGKAVAREGGSHE